MTKFKFNIASLGFLFLFGESSYALEGDFTRLCMNSPNAGIKNTIGILMEKVGVEPAFNLEACSLAETLLSSKTELHIGATKFPTNTFDVRALNPLTTLEPLKLFPQIRQLSVRVHNVDLAPLLSIHSLESLSVHPEILGFNQGKAAVDLTPSPSFRKNGLSDTKKVTGETDQLFLLRG